MRKLLLSALIAAGVAMPAFAGYTTYAVNYTSPSNSAMTGNAGNSLSYTVGTGGAAVTATVTAWNATLQTSGANSGKYLLSQAYLGQYQYGLGVTSAANDDLNANGCDLGDCGTHQIDNQGNTANSLSYDFLQISFSQAVTLGTVGRNAFVTANASLNGGAWDDDFSYGKAATALSASTYVSDLSSYFQGTVASNGGCAYNSDYYCADSSKLSNDNQASAATASKNWYIAAAIGSNYGGDGIPDAFKLSNTNVYYIGAVPEPTTWATMLIGFAAVGVAMRRNGRGAALNFS